MTPSQYLLLTLGCTAVALAANLVSKRSRQRALAALARSWNMHYSARDVFRLADQLGGRLPAPGAAHVHVSDVIYGIEGEHHRYLFSVEYTLGLVHAKQRVVRAASFREPKGRTEPFGTSPLELGDVATPLLEQYRTL